ncbi:hypothetical protein F5B21DRAFT_410698 [Xylaria acuta]|nr:hypothetical protein F5B21DRAFT_410698 [Xylaria acuta]
MDTSDQIIYNGCWAVLMLYIFTTLVVFTRRSCIACAASFLCACILFLDLCLFNTWFFLPAFRYHIREIDVHGENVIELFRVILCSEAAWDVYLIMLGSFGSWLAVFNAAGMLKTEGCAAMVPHRHGSVSRCFIKYAYRMCDHLGFGDNSAAILPTTHTSKIYFRQKGLFGVFADTYCYPFRSRRHSQTTGEKNLTEQDVVVQPGRCRSPGVIEKIQFSESTKYADSSYHAESMRPTSKFDESLFRLLYDTPTTTSTTTAYTSLTSLLSKAL